MEDNTMAAFIFYLFAWLAAGTVIAAITEFFTW